MGQSNGRRGTLYEQVLEYARREIDEASSKIDELHRTLRLLEARVEAAKSVYEAVAARLNLEDEVEEGAEFQDVSYPDTPPRKAPEPPEEADMDMIRRHLEARARQTSEAEEVTASFEHVEAGDVEAEEAEAEEAEAGEADGFSIDMIRRHLEARAEAEAGETEEEEASEMEESGSSEALSMDMIRRHLEARASRAPVPAKPEAATKESEEEPEEEEPEASGALDGFSIDMMRRHLEDRSRRAAKESGEPDAKGSSGGEFPGLSEADRRLIEEHMRRRAEAAREG